MRAKDWRKSLKGLEEEPQRTGAMSVKDRTRALGRLVEETALLLDHCEMIRDIGEGDEAVIADFRAVLKQLEREAAGGDGEAKARYGCAKALHLNERH